MNEDTQDTVDVSDLGDVEIPSDPHSIGEAPASQPPVTSDKPAPKPAAQPLVKKPVTQEEEPADEEEDPEGGAEPEEDPEAGAEEDTEGDGEVQEDADEGYKTVRRDYDKYPKEAQKFLRQMPNKFFNAVAPYLEQQQQEVARLKGQLTEYDNWKKDPNRLPDSYWQHPQAYTLSPEYNNIVTHYNRATQEADHYTQQLARVQAGEESVETIIGYHKDGTPAYQTFKVTPQTQAQILTAMNRAQIAANTAAEKADALQRSFKQSFESTIQYVNEGARPHFEQLMPELQPTKEDMDNFRKIMPPQVHNDPLYELSAKMFSVIMRQGQQLAKFLKVGEVKKTVENDRKLAGPRPKPGVGKVVTKKQPPSKEVLNFDEIEAEMQ